MAKTTTAAQQPSNPLPAPVASTAEKGVTMNGFSVRIFGFVPIPKDDLDKQIEISMLVRDIRNGKRPLADLTTVMVDVETTMANINKRFTEAEIAAWKKPATPPAAKTEKPDEDAPEDGGGQPDMLGDEHEDN